MFTVHLKAWILESSKEQMRLHPVKKKRLFINKNFSRTLNTLWEKF